MNCICDLIDNEIFWIILIALLLLHCNGGCGIGTTSGCGCRG